MPKRLTQAATFLAMAAMALTVTLTSAWAAGATDPARFRLTPALMARMDAVAAELKHLKPDSNESDDDDEDAESVEDIARRLDANPRVRAALARHQFTSREYATAVLAALHAGMVLAVEKGADPKALQAFTPEQRANVEVLRAQRRSRR
jgi:hypothetical protein